jgi:hypothetical protein
VDKYPLSALPVSAQPTQVPVVLGINWYTNFDNPIYDGGHWWIGKGDLGSIRGGHCVCLHPGGTERRDLTSWWKFYDQGREGACVGFGSSRAMTLLNRKRYMARWLWDMAKEVDPWSDTNPGDDDGTSVDAAMQVLAKRGHVTWKPGYAGAIDASYQERDAIMPDTGQGISVYRWATDVQDVIRTLGSDTATRLGAVPILNSWGTEYPHIVWMPGETLERLRSEDGEVAIPTDR